MCVEKEEKPYVAFSTTITLSVMDNSETITYRIKHPIAKEYPSYQFFYLTVCWNLRIHHPQILEEF